MNGVLMPGTSGISTTQFYPTSSLIKITTFTKINVDPLETIMESVRIAFKQDDFGNDIFARVSWQKSEIQSSEPKPIGECKTST
jgi:hypothetical protein